MSPFILFTVLFLCSLLKSYFNLFKPKKAPAAAAAADVSPKNVETAKADELGTIFSTFDGDGDGFVTMAELDVSLRRLKLPATPDEVRGMMERADSNGDGLIDVGEFRELYRSLEITGGETEMREAFGVFDGNKDGVITVEELGEVLVSMGLRRRGEAAAGDCEDMIRRVDLDGDGMVNFEEFKRMMMAQASGSFF